MKKVNRQLGVKFLKNLGIFSLILAGFLGLTANDFVSALSLNELGASGRQVMTQVGAVIDGDVDESCEANVFLGFRPWYKGLATRDDNDKCVIGKPATSDSGTTNWAPFVWVVVMNIIYDISLVAGLTATGVIIYGGLSYVMSEGDPNKAATGFIIYGGLSYVMSEGDPNKAAKGKNIIQGAVIGLILTIFASVITNTIIDVIISAT